MGDIAEYRGIDGLETLEDDWKALASAASRGSVFRSYEIVHAYVANLCGRPDAFRTLALTDGGRVLALMPLEMRTERALGRRIAVWGTPRHQEWDTSEVVCADPSQAPRLVAEAVRFLERHREGASLLVLGPTPARSPAWAASDVVARCVETESRRIGWFDAIDVTRGFEEIQAGLSKKLRTNLNCARNRLARFSGVRFETARGEDVLPALRRFVDLESAGWKGGAGTSLAERPDVLGFYTEIAETLGPAARFEIHSLFAEGRCAASTLCAREGDELAGLKIAFHPDFARCSPGQLLVRHVLERCCEDPLVRRYNLMSDEPWLDAWGATHVDRRQVRLGLGDVRGTAALVVRRVRTRTSRAK